VYSRCRFSVSRVWGLGCGVYNLGDLGSGYTIAAAAERRRPCAGPLSSPACGCARLRNRLLSRCAGTKPAGLGCRVPVGVSARGPVVQHRVQLGRHPTVIQRYHQQCDVNYFEIRRAVGPSSVWSYEFHRIIDGRISSPKAMRPYEMLPIPTHLEIVHITLLVVIDVERYWGPAP